MTTMITNHVGESLTLDEFMALNAKQQNGFMRRGVNCHSPEACARISAARTNSSVPVKEETKAKLSQANKGKFTRSQEGWDKYYATIAKRRGEGYVSPKSGVNRDPETVAKMRASRVYTPMSEEAKAKMRETKARNKALMEAGK